MDIATTYVAPRTCTVVGEGEETRDAKGSAAPLSNYANSAAYVLIAEPGAGKTTAFKTEAASQGGVYVTVRDFRTFDDKPEWHNTTLFLDGLDESRAGKGDGRTPLDDVRQKLNRLGCPRFRLSCRWADWMAANDQEALKVVSPDGTVTVIRLDPLSKRNIKDILANNHGVEDTDGFIKAARERGVDKLLTNPQNLDLIARSVSQGQWPDSRNETFDQACRMLVRESNGEHLAANPSITDTSLLIEAAGRLCAVQIISGAAGYTLPDRADPDDDFPSFTELYGGVGDDTVRNVLGTRLFVGVSEGKLAPAHRQIAEFLAAQYVSGLLEEGLPLARILAQITGFDGELLPSFRNFASWLAVHNKQSRKRLSQMNPSGMIYDGDRQTYSADEKRDIVRNLRRESYWNPWCSRSVSKVPGIGGIVSPELEGTFREILTDGERGHEHQSYVMLLMQMLADGEPLPALSDVLEQTVRDRTWNYGVRCAALDVLTSYHAHGPIRAETLKRMMTEIEDCSLDDPEDQLLGILLKALYPNVLSIAEVQRNFREPKLVTTTGEYTRFWMDHVPTESTPEQLAELLDCIAERFAEYRPFMVGDVGRYTRLGQLPLELLDRVLRETRWRNPGGSVAVDRLHEWLGVVSDPGLRLPDWRNGSIRSDLEWDADTLKELIAHGVETCLLRGEDCNDLVDRRLFGARPWRKYGQWCLDMALVAKKGKAAEFYLQELLDWVMDKRRADGLTVEEVRKRLAADEVLMNQFDEMAARRSRVETRTQRRTAPKSATDMEPAVDTEEQRVWQEQIEAQAPALRAGRGAPELLHRAAEAYLGLQDNSAGKTPRKRLGDLVGSRVDMIDLLLEGMEGTIAREGLPGCDDVVRLFDQNHVNSLVLPFVAGLHSLEQSGRLSGGDLTESQARLAVTILYMLPQEYLDPDSADGKSVYRPAWFQTVLRDNPALVADVLHRSAARKLETGMQTAVELRELANSEDHREVAELISLSVLEHFPQAETNAALQALCWALRAALKRCDWSVLERVIEDQLGRDGQLAGEHGCWLAAGYLLAPERHREDLRDLADYEDGLKSLAMFVAAVGRFPKDFTQHLAAGDFEPLVAALGAALRCGSLTDRAYWFTTDLIVTLGDDPSPVATEALEALSKEPDAEAWTPAIAAATEQQARKRREQEYRHSDIGKVVRTLDGGTPANAGDLAALVFDELKDLSLKIRDGSTSDWRQHWNVDSHNHPTSPKPEDACRDALLSDLQERLGHLGIDAQPEGVYAEDKRADIRVSFAGFNVPVEIKRSCHRDVWTAVRSQLITKYTRDPEAAGYGIYLVLWFGDTEECRPKKYEEWTPETAEDVRLKIQESLDDQEERLISVCVVDVSKPQ